MRIKPSLYALSLLLTLSTACHKKHPINDQLPTSRSFYMGFTPFPYDNTQQAADDTRNQVIAHGDLVLNHLDSGIPWDEALNNAPFPSNVSSTIDDISNNLKTGQKLFLTTSPLDLSRKHLAGYWNNAGTSQHLPLFWQHRSFDDSLVIRAFINYCQRIIDEAHPDYFAYVIEANAGLDFTTDTLNKLLTLCDTVYSTLKSNNPNLPIMLTLQDHIAEKTNSEYDQITGSFLPYTDYIAVSTYPFLDYYRPKSNPAYLPESWLQHLHNLAPQKPFAIAETSWIAEDLNIDNWKIHIKGKPTWQKDYLQTLCQRSNSLKAEFICWFLYRDYDYFYDKLLSSNDVLKDLALIWRDNGVLDGNANPRPSLSLWNQWLALPVQ